MTMCRETQQRLGARAGARRGLAGAAGGGGTSSSSSSSNNGGGAGAGARGGPGPARAAYESDASSRSSEALRFEDEDDEEAFREGAFDEDVDEDEDDDLYSPSLEIPGAEESKHAEERAVFDPKVGDLVDAIHRDTGFWRDAVVVERDGPEAVVRLLFDSYDETFRCDVRDDHLIAKYGIHCFVPQLAPLPKRGQVVDAMDFNPKHMMWEHVEVQRLGSAQTVVIRSLHDVDRVTTAALEMIRPYGERTYPEHRDQELRKRFVQTLLRGQGRRRSSFLAARRKRRDPLSGAQAQRRRRDPRPSRSRRKRHERDIAATGDPRYQRYVDALRASGMEVVPMTGDGNCLFRAVSHQVYGSAEYHRLVRESCMDYMESERAYFEPFVVGGAARFPAYIANKRRAGVWGDDLEIQAMCEIYDRPARVMAFDAHLGAKQLRTFHEMTHDRSRAPMILSFYGGGHYDSIKGPEFGMHLLDTTEGKLGELERERVAVSRARRAGHSEAEVGGLVASRRRDEQDRIDADVMESRQQYISSDRDLEDALEASLIQADEDEQALIDGAVRDSEDVSSTRAALRVSDVEATEQEAILEAIRQSSEQAEIQEALKASAVPSEEDFEREQLELALQASRREAGAGAVFGAGAYGGSSYHGEAAVDEEEDADLQRALEMSMSPHQS